MCTQLSLPAGRSAQFDADGVALAAIQGLNAKVEEQQREIADLRHMLSTCVTPWRSRRRSVDGLLSALDQSIDHARCIAIDAWLALGGDDCSRRDRRAVVDPSTFSRVGCTGWCFCARVSTPAERERRRTTTDCWRSVAVASVVPGAGIEPARPCGPGILSPLRLPVSPPGHSSHYRAHRRDPSRATSEPIAINVGLFLRRRPGVTDGVSFQKPLAFA